MHCWFMFHLIHICTVHFTCCTEYLPMGVHGLCALVSPSVPNAEGQWIESLYKVFIYTLRV